MRKTNKKLVSILMICIMIVQMFSTTIMALGASVGDIYIPIEATIYANKHYQEALEVVEEYIDFYGVTRQQLDDVKLGNPFVIYELDGLEQDEIYYYPLMDENDEIILLLCVMGTTEGWSISVSEEWVEDLNKIEDITSDYIFLYVGRRFIC